MLSQFSNGTTRAMTEEQFCQVVDAILNGKYSWACVLILKFAGYNPLHYIPYRTYNRLMKDNGLAKRSPHKLASKDPLAVRNLPHEVSLDLSSSQIHGGNGTHPCVTFLLR